MATLNVKKWVAGSKFGFFLFFEFSFVLSKVPFVRLIKSLELPIIDNRHPFVHFRTMKPISGFTLIELMVTVVVVSILSALAVPSMRTFIQNSRITTQANEFIADLNFARSEAIKRAANVTVCKSDNPTDATPTCSVAGTNWGVGRIVFVDSAIGADGQYDDATEDLLRVRETLEGNNTLDDAINLVVYTRTGAIDSGAMTFNLCDTRGATYGRTISIETTGRVALVNPAAAC